MKSKRSMKVQTVPAAKRQNFKEKVKFFTFITE